MQEKQADVSSIPGSGRSPGGEHGNPPVFSPGESHGERSLVDYSPWGRKESDMTEVTELACTHAHDGITIHGAYICEAGGILRTFCEKS